MSNKKHGTRYTTSSYIEKAKIIHNNKFDYSKVVYTSSHSKVKIICPYHGEFEQRACDHINQQQGCPTCSHNIPWTHEQYSLKSNNLYGDKFEIVTEYIGMKHPLTLRCKIHGEFTVKKAETHLKHSGACPECWYLGKLENLKPGNISKVEKEWLDSLSVPERQYKLSINNQIFLVDGFNPNTNTVYECYGSFWHGNPDKYDPNKINQKVKKTFGELYKNTITRENIIKQQYNLVTKWVN